MSITVQPVTPDCVAKISGLDLAKPLRLASTEIADISNLKQAA